MQQFQLSIPEPCHQNWDNMTPTEQGRFCNACAKEVIDFSMMTDNEVLNYFNTLAQDKVCGRALPSQLDRTITPYKDPVRKRFWYWHYITLFFLLFSKNSNAKPHGGILITPLNKKLLKQNPTAVFFNSNGKEKFGLSRIIAGKITDENGKGIPFAKVQVKGSSTYVIADAYGVYSINVNPETEVLEIIAAGYSNKIFILHGLTTYNFTLSPEACKNMRIMAGKMIQKPVVDDSIKSGTEKEDTSKMIAATEGMLPQIKGLQINLFNKYTQKTNDTRVVVLGGMRSIKDTKQPLLVVDSVQLPIGYLGTLNPNDIKSIGIMKGSSVYALYGADASNGVIVVTTKNNKAEVALKKAKDSVLNRSVNKIAGKIVFLVKPVTIKIYPNPVSRGSAFFVSLKQQQSRGLSIQVLDATGRILLNKNMNATIKEYVEKIETTASWSSGIYYIRIFDNSNKLISTNTFSVQ